MTHLRRAATAQTGATPVLDRATPVLDRATPVLDRATPVLAIAMAVLLLPACTAGGMGTPGAGPGTPGKPGQPGRSGIAQAGQAFPGRSGGAISVYPSGQGPPAVFFGELSGPGGPGGAIIALPAVGPAGSSGRPQIILPPIPPADSAETVALPLDSYEEVAVQQQDALAAAGDLLAQRCMAAAGFSYPVAAQPGGGTMFVQSAEYGGLGVVSLGQAETYGYKQPGPNGSRGSPAAPPSFVAEQNRHGPAWTSALLGSIPGARAGAPQHEGCLQAADIELYGQLGGNPNPDPVPGIAIQAAQWTRSDPRILAAQRAWSACMASSGLAYKSPAQAHDRNWPSMPTPAEIAAAVADVRCKTRTNLVNTWLTVEAAYQAALITVNLTSLSRRQASSGALLQRAERLLQISAAGILRVSLEPAGLGGFGAGLVPLSRGRL